jgi:hypothetical protein
MDITSSPTLRGSRFGFRLWSAFFRVTGFLSLQSLDCLTRHPHDEVLEVERFRFCRYVVL